MSRSLGTTLRRSRSASAMSRLTNIVDCDFDALRLGDKVRVLFEETENGPPPPMFRPL